MLRRSSVVRWPPMPGYKLIARQFRFRAFGVFAFQFTSLFRTPLLSRLSWYIRWSIRWVLGWPPISNHVVHPHRQKLTSGYIVMDYVENGCMLSASWDIVHDDVSKRLTLYRDIPRLCYHWRRFNFLGLAP
ncbi:hypothetical protein BN1708_008347 [Verticillium longisporum]|uniref:Uncharacterized protein n=1 Tax=Verticillium longisporum TaxID=100787 RepID=A0A0G4N341_VERLO|nr:hypothetical protein BN1708_008347 [Verticillium longisporum]